MNNGIVTLGNGYFIEVSTDEQGQPLFRLIRLVGKKGIFKDRRAILCGEWVYTPEEAMEFMG